MEFVGSGGCFIGCWHPQARAPECYGLFQKRFSRPAGFMFATIRSPAELVSRAFTALIFMRKSTMAEQDNKQIDRRKFMRLAGVGLVTTSLGGLAACGDSGSSSAPAPAASAPEPKPAAPMPKAEPAAPAPVAQAPAPAPAPAAAGRVTEDDPIAQSLGYKHNAAEVDLTKHPKRGEASAANEYCKNCILYQGGADDEWGPCSIFAGRQVNANGWCATYAPKS